MCVKPDFKEWWFSKGTLCLFLLVLVCPVITVYVVRNDDDVNAVT